MYIYVLIYRADSQSSTAQPTNFQQLVDLINNWTVSLENQEKQFLNQANEITVWDNMLTNQSTKVVFIYYLKCIIQLTKKTFL